MRSREHASAVPFSSRLVTVADADDSQFSTRRALHQLRVVRAEPPPTPRDQAPDADDRAPRPPRNSLAAKTQYNVLASRRPANALVVLPEGSGNDPAALKLALKKLKDQMISSGVHRLLRSNSHQFAFKSATARRKLKDRVALARQRKGQAARRRFDALEETRGR